MVQSHHVGESAALTVGRSATWVESRCFTFDVIRMFYVGVFLASKECTRGKGAALSLGGCRHCEAQCARYTGSGCALPSLYKMESVAVRNAAAAF